MNAPLAVLVLLLLSFFLLMLVDEHSAARVPFVLIGFGISIALIFYLVLPVVMLTDELLTASLKLVSMAKRFLVPETREYIGDPELIAKLGLKSFVIPPNPEMQRVSDLLSRTVFYFFIAIAAIFALSVGLGFQVLSIVERIAIKLGQFRLQAISSAWHRSPQKSISRAIFNAIIVIWWALLALSNAIGLILASAIVGSVMFDIPRGLYGGHFIAKLSSNLTTVVELFFHLDVRLASVVARVILMLWATPYLLIIVGAAFSKYLFDWHGREAWRPTKLPVNRNLPGLVKICAKLGMPVPEVRVVASPAIRARVTYLLMPWPRGALLISTSALSSLGDAKLEALLAHEMWHLKSHAVKTALLNLLSRCSLFGNGFLAVVQDSFMLEFEADDFAVRWARYRGFDRNVVGDMLVTLQSHNKLVKDSEESAALSVLPSYRPGAPKSISIGSLAKATFCQRLTARIILFVDMYFRNRVLSYLHPTLDERIARAGWRVMP